MNLEQKILVALHPETGLTARELAKRLGHDKSEINSILYKLSNRDKTRKNDTHQWFLLVRNKASAARIIGQAKSISSEIPRAATSCNHPAAQKPVVEASLLSNNIHTVQEIIWTDEQIIVINAPPGDRILVEAGPGTGKTAVACARVARLLREDNLTPSSILMVSFTRTAVAEMKNRIRMWADSGRVNAVNICTLDQAAFSFGVGCGQQFEKLMGSFEDNIQTALEHFTNNNALLLEYIRGLDHVIIDEAQDLIGPRSELATLLLRALRQRAGATIFADAAQAIYGFTTDVDGSRKRKKHFLESFDAAASGFKPAMLTKIHRTEKTEILNLFTNSRQTLTGPHSADATHVKRVIKAAEDAAPCEGDEVAELPLEDGDLLLYRKRASALQHAIFCPKLFRLRLPAHPPALFPWIGLVFSNCAEPVVSRTQFKALWANSVPVGMTDRFTADTAWELLHRFAGRRDDVEITRLRAKLSLPRPPVEFCQLDYGSVGPIFSTIHASKGREADRVFLMLPRTLDYLDGNDTIDAEEEARVFYVGSTRVRKQFLRGIAQTLVRTRRLEESSERVIQLCAEDKLKFQMGLARDFDDLAPISREGFYCPSAADAIRHQKRIITLWQNCLATGTPGDITAVATLIEANSPWPYKFIDANKQTLAWSAGSFGKDLWKMNDLVQDKFGGQRHPPKYINHLRLIGLRTRVLADDPAGLGRIHKPFADSGFWLAPMIVGFQSVKFPAHSTRAYHR